jgi:hypothetical protein
MERVGSISRRVLARLVAANDNLEWVAGDAARTPPRLGVRPDLLAEISSSEPATRCNEVAGSDSGPPRLRRGQEMGPAAVEERPAGPRDKDRRGRARLGRIGRADKGDE